MWELLLYIDDIIKIRYKDLKEHFGNYDIDNDLDILYKADLIRIYEAEIRDLENIAISSKGLKAARLVRNINKLQSELNTMVKL